MPAKRGVRQAGDYQDSQASLNGQFGAQRLGSGALAHSSSFCEFCQLLHSGLQSIFSSISRTMKYLPHRFLCLLTQRRTMLNEEAVEVYQENGY